MAPRFKLLGTNPRVKDPRCRADAGDARTGVEPLNFRALDEQLLKELLHRFRPKLVVLMTASDPSYLTPILLAKVPVVAMCD